MPATSSNNGINRSVSLGGSYPRSEALVKASWNFDKGLLPEDQLARVRGTHAQTVIKLQRSLGLAPLSNGLLAWHDLFRPVLESTEAFAVGGLVRLFETNKFLRQPIVRKPFPKEAPSLPAYAFEEVPPNPTAWKAILPSPYWLARAALDETRSPPADLALRVATHLNGLARRLEKDGFGHIQFNEPSLLYESTPDLPIAEQALERAVHGLKAPTTLNFPNGNAAPHFEWLLRLPSTFVGIDFVETSVEELPNEPISRGLFAQVVDSQESRVEGRDELRSLADAIERRLRPPQIAYSHTWDLEFVPHEVAQRKLQALGTLVTQTDVIAR